MVLLKLGVLLLAGFRWKTSGSRILALRVFINFMEDTTKLVARINCEKSNIIDQIKSYKFEQNQP